MDSRIDKLISFLKEIEKFKLIKRQVYLSDLISQESDAEHAWHLAMALILFQKDLPQNTNFIKLLKMALIHDLVEIYAGDTFAYDKKARKSQKERERKAAKILFAKLPKDLKKEFTDLFNEYEERKTKESKIVVSFDKLQPILQNILSKGKAWKIHGVKFDHVVKEKQNHMLHDKTIFKIYTKLMDEFKKVNYLK